MHSRVLRFAAPLAALALVAATPRTPWTDGWKFTWKVTIDSTTAQRAPSQPSTQVQLIPGKLRMDFIGEPQPGQKKGGYMIIDAEAGTMAMVSPEDKTAMIMSADGMGALAGAVGGVVKMDVSDVKVAVDDEGAGEKILGRSTHKYRITRDYAMQVSVFGKKQKSTHHSVTTLWITPDVTIDRSWEAWSGKFARGASRLGGDAMKKLIDAEKDLPRGVPLRQRMTTTDTDDKGKAETTTMTWEMTELKKGDIPASAFEIPKDYQVTDMKQTMAEMDKKMQEARDDCEKEHGKGAKECDMSQVNVDSLVAATRTGLAEGLKEGLKEGAKETAKDAIKKGIFGKLKKPD